MYVTDGPVGIVRERVDRADGHERSLKGREAVEHRRHHHEAQRGVVAHPVPGAVEGEQRVGGRRPRGHQQHDREGHAQGLHPLRQRGVVQVVRARPHVHEGDAPEADDRQPVGEDRPPRLLGHEVVHHAQEPGGKEEGHGVVAVPPLRHRVLHAGEQRIALGAARRDRQGEVVDDVQHRHHQDEGEVVPVGHVDVRLLAARQRPQVEREVGDPDDHQPDVGVPFGLGIFARLRDPHEVAAGGEDAEQIVAQQHEPGAELVGQAGPRGPLHDVERGRDQRVAAEAEDHAAGVYGPQAAETGPGRVEGHVREHQQPGDPGAEEHANHGPGHGEADAELGGGVVVLLQPAGIRFRRFVAADQHGQGTKAQHRHYPAMGAEQVGTAGRGHRNAAGGERQRNHHRHLSLVPGELRSHAAPV